MNEVMTMDEINARFDSEWVLIGDPETDESLAVKRGRVLCHARDREDLYCKARAFTPGRFAIIYTGPAFPEGTEVVL